MPKNETQIGDVVRDIRYLYQIITYYVYIHMILQPGYFGVQKRSINNVYSIKS